MTLLRRTPREVYRVYGEDEFLEGLEGEQLPDAPEPRPDIEENRQEPPDEPALMATQAVVGRRRRLAVMATLGGTGCALAVIVGASIRPAPPGVGSRPAPRQVAAGHNPAPGTLLARGARSPRTAARTRPPSPGASGAVRGRSRRDRVAVGAGVADATAAQRGTASKATTPAATTSVASPMTRRIEFGFER